MTTILKISTFPRTTLKKKYVASAALYLFLLPWLPWGVAAVLKPLPILCLLIHLTRQQHFSKNLLFYTLSFAMLGDIMLALPLQEAFMLGMLSFMLMHCGYCAQLIPNFRWQLKRFLIMLIIIFVSALGYWLLHDAMKNLAIPTLTYLIFLLSTVFFALQSSIKNKHLLIGALLFWLSDSLLGFNEFMVHETWLNVLVMTSYYTSQWNLYIGMRKK